VGPPRTCYITFVPEEFTLSYTQFVATASCLVVDDFNLESYLNGLSERCVKEDNFIVDHYGETDGKVDLNFANYVRISGGKLLIECDSEDFNSNSEVWDWLIDQFLPVMTSRFMEVKSTTIDSRSGVDVNISYCDKNGTSINTDDLIRNYINSVPVA
jgi:hypothetical protein